MGNDYGRGIVPRCPMGRSAVSWVLASIHSIYHGITVPIDVNALCRGLPSTKLKALGSKRVDVSIVLKEYVGTLTSHDHNTVVLGLECGTLEINVCFYFFYQ